MNIGKCKQNLKKNMEVIEMKIEIVKKVKFEDLEVGTVIEMDRVVGIVTANRGLFLLKHTSNENWFDMAKGYLNIAESGDFKVLGKATKLIVEEI